MNKLGRKFTADAVLYAYELNELVTKINEIVTYINGKWENVDPDNPNTPVDPEETWPEETDENKDLFTTVTIPQDIYTQHFANASAVRIVIVKSTNNSSWSLHQYADTNNFNNNYAVYLPSTDTTLYYKIIFVDLDHGYSYEYPEIITRP